MHTTNPHVLLAQGKITQAQYAYMLKRELHIMKVIHMYRISKGKAHTDKKSTWAYKTEETAFSNVTERRSIK